MIFSLISITLLLPFDHEILLFNAPVPETLSPRPADTLSPRRLLDSCPILLIDHTRQHERRHKHPDIPALHSPPPPPLDAHLPQTIYARLGGVQKHPSSPLLLQHGPETSQKPAEEEPLRGEERSREPGLEETDGRPGSRDGARDEGRHAQAVGDQAVEGGHGEVVERLELGQEHGRVDEEEEAGHGWEGFQPKGEIGACARRVVGVEGRARERVDQGVGA